MKTKTRIFKPFNHLVIPVIHPQSVTDALSMARMLGGKVSLVGLVPVSAEAPISAEASTARQVRAELQSLMKDLPIYHPPQVFVSRTPILDLQQFLAEDPPDLMILEWPQSFQAMCCSPSEILANPVCDIAIVRGPWPETIHKALVPIRGGPYAELALRFGLALPRQELLAFNLTTSNAPKTVEAPFRGLASILPNLPEVTFKQIVSDEPVQTILNETRHSDLLVMGASARTGIADKVFSPIVDQILSEASCATVVMKSQDPLPAIWTGKDGEMAGAQAISVLVDKWFAENTYHADEFDDLDRLLEIKKEQGVTISLALPALNEEETVGQVIQSVKHALKDSIPLLDEIVLIDSNSKDRTREIAASLDVPVHIHQELLPEHGPRRGKGEALWKSLYVTHGDIVVWIDTDIVNIHPRFVYGVIGPLLANPRLQFVKGFYQRPLQSNERLQAGGGGRVTELTARPLINLFYPELSGVIQPLSGEYGGRRAALEQMPFYSGYGVEIGLLIGIFEKYGLSAIAQVDLLERIHHNQDLEALSKMSFAILQTVFRKLESRYQRSVLEDVNKTMKLIRHEGGSYYLDVEEVVEQERPPMLEIPEYLQLHPPK
ncbi:MAG: glucosyl-3-phosphoglycerate synthase [Anaerolineaceae bacterium]|nr:glucosyl-3-phosphoglycerate synthase [Anaerolineaceae bacterium]